MTQEALDHQLEVEADGARRVAQVKEDKDFMAGVYRSMKDSGPATPWKDLKRK
jgi:hypothetical protein